MITRRAVVAQLEGVACRAHKPRTNGGDGLISFRSRTVGARVTSSDLKGF